MNAFLFQAPRPSSTPSFDFSWNIPRMTFDTTQDPHRTWGFRVVEGCVCPGCWGHVILGNPTSAKRTDRVLRLVGESEYPVLFWASSYTRVELEVEFEALVQVEP